MPTRVPSVRRPWWCVAVALCLAVGSTPRADAKPPDLPQPTDYEFAPGDNGKTTATRMLVPEDLFEEEEQQPHGLSPADRCAALRTVTRCILFGLNPLTPLTGADGHFEFDDTPAAPILHVGDREVSVGKLLRDAVIAFCTGPFSPVSWQLDPHEAPASPCVPAGEEDQDENVAFVPAPPASMGPCMSPPSEKDFCPRTHECPAQMAPPSGPAHPQQAGVAEQYMILAQILAGGGHLGAACECYQRVCVLCPGTCLAREAMNRMQALYSSMSHGAAKPAAGEEQEKPSVCPAAEHAEQKAPDKSHSSRSFIENIEALEKAARLYEEAEVLMHEGKVDEACVLYEKIRALCPGHRYANMAADRLTQLQGLRTKPVAGTEEGQEPPSAEEIFDAMGDLYSGCINALLGSCAGSSCRCALSPMPVPVQNSNDELLQIEIEAGPSTDKKKSLEERLRQSVSLNCKEATLTRLLDGLCDWQGINVVLDKKALEEAGVNPDTKITLRLDNVELRSVLNIALRQVDLVCKIQDNVILVTTPRVAQGPLSCKTYDIADLVRTGKFHWKGREGSRQEGEVGAAEEVIALIEDTIAAQSWASAGGDGTIHYFSRGRALVVSQDAVTHEQIAELLSALRQHLKTEQSGDSEEATSIWPEARRPLVDAGYDISDVLTTHKLDLDHKTDRAQVKPVAIPAEELIALIRDGVVPESWDIHGGRGTINYNPELKTLFIEQTPEVHEAIQDLLDARRREIERHKKECEREAEQPDGDLACCEEEAETAAESVKPNVCFDFDQHKDGAIRVRCQLGRFCFRLDCDQQKHGCLLLGLGIDSGNPVSQFFGSALEGVLKGLDSAIKPDDKDSSDKD